MSVNTPMALPKIIDRSDPVNPNATAETKALYRFLKSLGGSKYWILGTSELYHNWNGKPDDGEWTAQWNAWGTITGKYPALVHHDYTAITTAGIGATRYANMRQHIIDQAVAGCIIQLFHPIGNPTTGTLDMVNPYGVGAGQNGDTTGGIAPIKSGGAQFTAWRAYLSDLADFISGLVNPVTGKKIPVIWRPFHECTVSAYWWSGAANAANFITVWQDMVTYMVTTKGCNNVLFNLNWDSAGPNSVTAWTNWYAGDTYVDIVGFDSYDNDSVLTNSINLDSNALMAAGYQAALAIAATGNKPIMLNEFGYHYAKVKPGIWDYHSGPYIEDKYPALCSGLVWNDPYGPGTGDSVAVKASATAMVNSPYCLTLDKLVLLPVFRN